MKDLFDGVSESGELGELVLGLAGVFAGVFVLILGLAFLV